MNDSVDSQVKQHEQVQALEASFEHENGEAFQYTLEENVMQYVEIYFQALFPLRYEMDIDIAGRRKACLRQRSKFLKMKDFRKSEDERLKDQIKGPEEQLEIDADRQRIKEERGILQGLLLELTRKKRAREALLAWFYEDRSTYSLESGALTLGALDIAKVMLRRWEELPCLYTLKKVQAEYSTDGDLPSGALALVKVYTTLQVGDDPPRSALDVFEVDKTVRTHTWVPNPEEKPKEIATREEMTLFITRHIFVVTDPRPLYTWPEDILNEEKDVDEVQYEDPEDAASGDEEGSDDDDDEEHADDDDGHDDDGTADGGTAAAADVVNNGGTTQEQRDEGPMQQDPPREGEGGFQPFTYEKLAEGEGGDDTAAVDAGPAEEGPTADATRASGGDADAAAEVVGGGGAHVATGGGVDPVFDYLASVTAFYQQHNPEKVDDVSKTLAKYKDNEATLVRKLEEKYNAKLELMVVGGAGAEEDL